MLEVKNLMVDYGAIKAVKSLNITVPRGHIVAILGANGAGKSTTLRTVSGIVKAKSGEIFFDGKNITEKSVYGIAKAGISHCPEGRQILNGLTVEENLRVGACGMAARRKDPGVKTIEQNYDYVYTLFPRLAERRKQQANTLSGGEQQMLAIGRSLMASPKLLIMDEPSLGLAPIIVASIFKCIKEIRQNGATVLLVEQNALQSLKIADYAYVLELGKVSMEGKASELIHDERLVEAYLGGKK
ncbi:MAG: ABC transporter ATP-binding protein [Treponema sp.]|jgi:branched-chain amino acid transport system ATP-binding protein|nr:ABC transporter ATP-binding protein [Treponema sp.]